MAENKNTLPVNQNNEPIDLFEDEGDDSMAAFIARMEAAYADLETQKDVIIKYYSAGETDKFNATVDSLTDTIAERNPEFQDNIAELKQLRSHPNPDSDKIATIIARQNNLYGDIRALIIHECDLPDEARLSENEKARENIRVQLSEHFSNQSYTSSAALEALGMTTFDEKTQETLLTFPVAIVPQKTTDLWESYLAAVTVHVKAAEDLVQKRGDQRIVEEADRTRTYAHNAITKDLYNILDLQPSDQWTLQDMRNFLAKLRDQVMPTREAALSVDSNKRVMEHLAELDTFATLATRTHL